LSQAQRWLAAFDFSKSQYGWQTSRLGYLGEELFGCHNANPAGWPWGRRCRVHVALTTDAWRPLWRRDWGATRPG
jgi:hypothetical protein